MLLVRATATGRGQQRRRMLRHHSTMPSATRQPTRPVPATAGSTPVPSTTAASRTTSTTGTGEITMQYFASF